MIDSFSNIGNRLLGDAPNQRTILNNLTRPVKWEVWSKKEKKNVPNRPIIINLDTHNDEIHIYAGNALSSEKRKEYFVTGLSY